MKKHPQDVLDKTRQVTLQFKTKAERDEWKRWYRRDGSRHFWGWLAHVGPKRTKKDLYWRKVAEDKVTNWPKDNESFVE